MRIMVHRAHPQPYPMTRSRSPRWLIAVQRSWRSTVAFLVGSSSVLSPLVTPAAIAQQTPYCQLPAQVSAQKEQLLQASLQGDRTAQSRYRAFMAQHAEQLQHCRTRTWPQQQAIWLRLYPCDVRPGQLEAILDRIVNRGYNRVYVEVFANGQVLLPKAQNKTVWPSVVRGPGLEQRDLLAEAIAKGRERGLQVYAWMFSLNFGNTYAQQPDGDRALARNGRGETSAEFHTAASLNASGLNVSTDETFADPYSAKAQIDYFTLVQEVVRRRPDGVLFDYIRYPRGTGASSVASRVSDLWIYGNGSQEAFLQRAQNQSGQDLLRRVLERGYVTVYDLQAIAQLYPTEPYPLWQGFDPTPLATLTTPEQRQPFVQSFLWRLSVSHAMQGIVDFLTMAIRPVQQQGMAAGAVFFPEGNQPIGQGFDSRLQPWDRFPQTMEWHPMSYATCNGTDCIVAQVKRVLSQASDPRQVMPVLAGTWGHSMGIDGESNGAARPPLEAQMQALRYATPQITSVSHFAFSWQEPAFEQQRRTCRLQ